ncbi:MAG: hypothetical protein ABSH28_20450 [Acidobacteriota bacterium]|jgi:hypothetical protein
MHPNTFLQTFWRLELKPWIFVAMSFDQRYQSRFDNVVAPAISTISVEGIQLQPYRVDLSKSGDSILTDISEGIAHSRLVLADVSTTGKDSVTGHAYRNANVMYEVGIALACRQPHEVLLVRDDRDRFLFDVSTIPHKTIDFTCVDRARSDLHEELLGRLREAKHLNDARVERAVSGLSGGEIGLLKYMASLPPTNAWGRQNEGDVTGIVSIPRLLDKHLIRVVGEFEAGFPAYQPTPLGYVVAKLVERGLPKIKADKKETDQGQVEAPK